MIKHLNIKIFGKVQGVYFRANTKDKADNLRLKGFVKNEDDGSVYIEVEGDNTKLTNFISWCKVGPPNASVEKVDIEEGKLKNFEVFEIVI